MNATTSPAFIVIDPNATSNRYCDTERQAQSVAFAWAMQHKRPVTVIETASNQSWEVYPER